MIGLKCGYLERIRSLATRSIRTARRDGGGFRVIEEVFMEVLLLLCVPAVCVPVCDELVHHLPVTLLTSCLRRP